MNKPRMLVWFSCGAASAVAAKLAVLHYAGEFNIEICYCDTSRNEHVDGQRFLKDVERWIERPITILRSTKYVTVQDVQRGEKYIVGPRGAACSRILKKQVREAYQRPDDVHVLGLTADEVDRIDAFESRHRDLDCEWILRDRAIAKSDCFQGLKSAGIELPAMYRMGYSNNNCIGCVKGGMGYWNRIRRDFPERFAEQAAMEREIGATILKDRRNGISLPIYLDQLDPLAGTDQPIDLEECGMFCDSIGQSVLGV